MKDKPPISVLIKNFNKIYSNKPIFTDINLKVYDGEFVCIIGPNGCGKSTILNGIAGLIDYKGAITKISSNMGLVGQNTAEMLLPWFTVKSNIMFPGDKDNVDHNLFTALLEITKLNEYEDKYPYQLSGGMRQLLLIARALLNKSDIILLDEPFKSLDFEMAKKMQQKVLELWSIYKPTIIMVSHDIDESIFMADKVIIFSEKPTLIKKTVKINLPRPRSINLLATDEFRELKQEVLNVFLS